MYEIRAARSEDGGAVLDLVSRLQPQPEHHIGYHGMTMPELVEEMAGLRPAFPEGAVVATDAGGKVRGALYVDVDREVGRAWLYGPFVDLPADHPATDPLWATTADSLYERALGLPALAEVADLELFGHVRHRLLARFADRHDFRAGVPSRVFVLGGPALRTLLAQGSPAVPLPDDERARSAVAVLHERCFPSRTVTGRQLVAGERDHVVVVLPPSKGEAGTGRIGGYAAGYVQQEEYYIDYVAVEPELRGLGLGERLVRGLLCELDSRHGARPQAAAVVASTNAASATMFARLGFDVDLELVTYRRREPVVLAASP